MGKDFKVVKGWGEIQKLPGLAESSVMDKVKLKNERHLGSFLEAFVISQPS